MPILRELKRQQTPYVICAKERDITAANAATINSQGPRAKTESLTLMPTAWQLMAKAKGLKRASLGALAKKTAVQVRLILCGTVMKNYNLMFMTI